MLGGPDAAGIGWAVGVDRTLLAVQAEGLDVGVAAGVQAFVVPLGAEAKRLPFGSVGQLRQAGVAADTVYGDRGLKGAMKAADRSGASHVVVIGDRDLAEGVGQLKDMRTGEQHAVPVGELFDALRRATVGESSSMEQRPLGRPGADVASSGWARGSSAVTGVTSTTTPRPTSSTPRSTPG